MSKEQFVTRAAFEKWLRERDNIEEVVGYAHSTSSCPLANCLKANRMFIPYVSEEVWSYGYLGPEKIPPQWVQTFVRKLDNNYGVSGVTAKEALSILKQC